MISRSLTDFRGAQAGNKSLNPLNQINYNRKIVTATTDGTDTLTNTVTETSLWTLLDHENTATYADAPRFKETDVYLEYPPRYFRDGDSCLITVWGTFKNASGASISIKHFALQDIAFGVGGTAFALPITYSGGTATPVQWELQDHFTTSMAGGTLLCNGCATLKWKASATTYAFCLLNYSASWGPVEDPLGIKYTGTWSGASTDNAISVYGTSIRFE